MSDTYTFIQWKNTSLCMDFTCLCGVQSHLDGDFAHVIECGACHAQFEMPTDVPVRLITPEAPASYHGWEPKVTELDDEGDLI